MNIQTNDKLQMYYDSIDALAKLAGIENPTAAQRSQSANHMAIVSGLKAGASREEIASWEEEKFRRELNLPSVARLRSDPSENKLYRDFLLTGESRGAELPIEFRDNIGGGQALSYGSGAVGGTFVPFGYHSELIQSLTQYDEVLDPAFSSQFDTDTGQPMSSAQVDDNVGGVFNKSVIVAEAGQSTNSDVIAATVSWPTCPTFRSGRTYYSIELIQDSPLLASIVKMTIARRHSLGIGASFITGLGNSVQPAGLTTSLPASTTITSAAPTLTLAEFENLYSKLDAAYVKDSVFYMASGTLMLLIKLLENAGRPMIGPVRSFLQVPIAVCNSMNAVTAGATAVVVLANKNYISQRFVPKASAIRQYSQAANYIDRGMIGVEGFTRCDQRLLLFGSNNPPVTALNIHS